MQSRAITHDGLGYTSSQRHVAKHLQAGFAKKLRQLRHILDRQEAFLAHLGRLISSLSQRSPREPTYADYSVLWGAPKSNKLAEPTPRDKAEVSGFWGFPDFFGEMVDGIRGMGASF